MERMNLYVFNKNHVQIGLVKETTSVQWLRKYNEQGQFAIHVHPTKTNLDLFKQENIIVNVENNTIGFIEYTMLKNKDGVAYDLEVKGHLDNLYDRINLRTANIKKVQDDLFKMIEANKRGLDIILRKHQELNAVIEETETTWKPLSETVSEICKKCGYGYRMIRYKTPVTNAFNVLELYEGKETKVIFSEEIGNIVISEYLKDISDYKNFAYVAGEGEGTARKVVTIDQSNGQPIRELYVDAKDLQKTWTDESNVEHTYSDAEYETVLRNRGIEKLNELKINTNFRFDIMLDNRTFVYGKDYEMGDIVTVKSELYKISKRFRIAEIKDIQEKGRKRVATLEEV